MSEVIIDNVCMAFNDVQAVKGVQLTIADGEFVVLLGPTGAGKTSTLRLVAGLEMPDSGRVLFDGEDVTHLDASLRDVTFVFQQYSLYPHYTVYENMSFPLKAPGRKMKTHDIKARVGEIAEMLRISHKLQNKATELSGGEMQRVSIGRALVRSPKVFLMDEPLSSLDAKLREDLRVELKRIQQDLGATILYVTHDQLEAMTLADRIGILEQGELVQVGQPQDVYEKPWNINAARRLGSPLINIFDSGALGINATTEQTRSIGLRPEDVVINRTAGSAATVMTVEHLGAESVVLLESDGQHIHSFMSQDMRVHEGDQVFVTGNLNKIIEFDQHGTAVANG